MPPAEFIAVEGPEDAQLVIEPKLLYPAMPPYVSLLFAALSETDATQLNTRPLFSPTTPPAPLLLLTEPETVQLRISA